LVSCFQAGPGLAFRAGWEWILDLEPCGSLAPVSTNGLTRHQRGARQKHGPGPRNWHGFAPIAGLPVSPHAAPHTCHLIPIGSFRATSKTSTLGRARAACVH
jgi:hypothetical protein